MIMAGRYAVEKELVRGGSGKFLLAHCRSATGAHGRGA